MTIYDPPSPEEPDEDPIESITLSDEVLVFAADLHARGRRATAAHRHVEGVLCREIANNLRALIDVGPLDYDGRIPDPWAQE